MDDRYPPDERMNPHMLAIGRVTTAWGSLEYVVNRGIWELANVEQFIGASMTSQISAPAARIRAYMALLELRGSTKPLIKKFNVFSQQMDGVARQRNRIVHDPWTYNQTQGYTARLEITADKRLSHQIIRTEVSELDDVRNKIVDLITRFQVLHIEAVTELPPWPRDRFLLSAGLAVQMHQPPKEES